MKISILLESFQPEYFGGRETRWRNLIDQLSKSNQLCILADFQRCKPEVAFPNVNATFVNIGPLPQMYALNGNRSLWHAVIYTLRSFKLLKIRSDFILTDQTPLISIPVLRFISMIKRSNLSITWHEIWSFRTWLRYSKILGIPGIILQSLGLILSKNIIVPSKQVALDLSSGLISRESKVIPNGVRGLEIFPTISINTSRFENVRLLYVGRLIKHKNCDFLIEVMKCAIKLDKKWTLTIVGQGPMRNELIELSSLNKLDPYIKFRSDISDGELSSEYLSSDVFVFPSQREGFGISVAEALSVNLPVVLLDVPENASTALITSRTIGIKIQHLRVEDWIQAIEASLDDKHGKVNSAQQQFLSWESVSEEFSHFLLSLKNK